MLYNDIIDNPNIIREYGGLTDTLEIIQVMSWVLEIWNGVFPSMPCSVVAKEGTACTPSSRPSSSARGAWPSFCGGTWAGNVPSSESEVQGLWPAPV